MLDEGSLSSVRKSVAIVGCGFVADFYMRSIELHAEVDVVGAFDIRRDRLETFCAYWKLKSCENLEMLLAELPEDGVVLNLTSPAAHYEVTHACLQFGRHVYSEKPLATDIDQALELAEFAKSKNLLLAGAPCSYLSEAARTLDQAIDQDLCGPVRLIYAELDDGYIPQAPYHLWISESGAPWPYEDEMRTGCTLEHAGYVLTWLIAIFGSIKSITAFSAKTIDKKLDPDCETPDTSIGIINFEAGQILRLTITIVAPHNHQVLITGDNGTIGLNDTWDNYAKVKYRKRLRVRRRLLESPIAKRLRLRHPQDGARAAKRGASKMNYFLGANEMLRFLKHGGDNLASLDLALHTTEATLALQNAGVTSATYLMRTRCDPLPLHKYRAFEP